MEEALHDVPLYLAFAGQSSGTSRIPDETMTLRFRHLLEKHNLALDATLISAPSSTKNAGGDRDREMKQAKKGNNWYFGMKARIGVDIASGLVHAVATKSANVNNLAGALLHGKRMLPSVTPPTRACTSGSRRLGPRGTWRCARCCAGSSKPSSRRTSWPSGWRR
jgi:IS5 family transposase